MSAITRLAFSGLLIVMSTGALLAQESRTEVACGDRWGGGDRRSVNVCESREITLAPAESLQINGRPNGSVTVTGWDRTEIRVQAQIRSWDRDEAEARARLDQIRIDTDGEIRARGPDVQYSWSLFGRRNGGWNVDFEIMAPHDTELWIESVNGGVSVAAIRGHVDAETVNGGIHLTDVSAATRGRTVNGGISVELTGKTIDGDGLDLRTTNGGIVMRVPADFSAKLDVETVNGGIHADFPVTREGNRNREVSATLGSGGPLIRARTVNGGVQIEKL